MSEELNGGAAPAAEPIVPVEEKVAEENSVAPAAEQVTAPVVEEKTEQQA